MIFFENTNIKGPAVPNQNSFCQFEKKTIYFYITTHGTFSTVTTYQSLMNSMLVLVGNCMVAYCPTIPGQLSPCTDTTISLRRVETVATGHCHRLSFLRISPSSPNQQLKQRVKLFCTYPVTTFSTLWPVLLFLGWLGQEHLSRIVFIPNHKYKCVNTTKL